MQKRFCRFCKSQSEGKLKERTFLLIIKYQLSLGRTFNDLLLCR